MSGKPALPVQLLISERHHEKTINLHMRKTKTSISFAVTGKLIVAFVFATIPLFFQPLAICYACTTVFVSGLFGNHIVGFLIMWLISV